jgi:hypothetical protein
MAQSMRQVVTQRHQGSLRSCEIAFRQRAKPVIGPFEIAPGSQEWNQSFRARAWCQPSVKVDERGYFNGDIVRNNR